MAVNVSAEENRPQWTHQKTGTEGRQRQHQRSEGAVRREEGLGDGRGVEAVDHEVEHFEKVAADNAKDRFAVAGRGGHF